MRNTNSCTLRIPPDVEYLLEKIHEAGFDVWLVGGAIRDFLYGWPPKDWDLATEASPQEIIRLFPRVIPVGIRHDTVQVYTGERAIEVTSYRSRGAEGILSDLGRRDFTVNALAMAYPNRTVIDLFAGRHDLQAGILRAVGDARARFSEDPLRALRAGRFVSVYGLSIEENTFAALTDEAEKLGSVAVERIRTEMFKLLLGDNVFSAFEWMRRGKVLGQIFPEVLEGHDESGRCKEDVYRHL
ncbi:MAG: CCA tRNA nucleotidyltransferase, partial [Desulforhabdus sp.]|nr:CCA tRNA nucleotidyltransferase [Desulforhabdus sp.]